MLGTRQCILDHLGVDVYFRLMLVWVEMEAV
jgi:hypothetical protein